ncbi:MAG: hypothetical protein ACAH83_09395 [Alphaproteobacteria bacterium]
MIFKRLGQTIDKFNKVLAEGNYRVPPMSWGRLVRGLKPELPATSEVAVGTTMIDYGKSLGNKFMWASIVALVSITAIKWAAIGFAALGVAVYTTEYFRAKKSREDEIVEINFAGQRIKGKRADLYRLNRAQLCIMNITTSLQGAEANTAADAIRTIVDTVKDERARVAVLDSGRYGAGKEAYAFTEPDFRLVLDETALPEKHKEEKAAASAFSPETSLREAWAATRYNPDVIVDRMVALQESLPPEIMEKVNDRMKTARKPGPEQP